MSDLEKFSEENIIRPFRNEADERPSSLEESLPQIEQILEQAHRTVVITDLDGTIVPYMPNPEDCVVDPKAHEALLRIEKAGVPVVALTARSGRDGARVLNIPGSLVVGSNGWEVYVTDLDDPTKGESIITEEFDPYAPELANVLGEVRKQLFEYIAIESPELSEEEFTTEITTQDGPIIMERKAVNEKLPEGLILSFNLNRVNPDKWGGYLEVVQSAFEQNASPELQKIFGLVKKEDTTGTFPSCGITISPRREGKGSALVQILRTDEDRNPITGALKRKSHFLGQPGGYDTVVFIGDTDQDASALAATQLTGVLAGRGAIGAVVARESSHDQKHAIRRAGVSLKGISGNAEFLEHAARVIEAKAQK